MGKVTAGHSPHLQLVTGRLRRDTCLQFSEAPHDVLREAGTGLELGNPLQGGGGALHPVFWFQGLLLPVLQPRSRDPPGSRPAGKGQ